MSLEIVRGELRRFLSSAEPEVLVLKGPWGVGKTYAWNKILKSSRDEGVINLKKYSYVSLFGINSLDAFKFAIFEQQIDAKLIGVEPSLDTFRTSTSSLLTSLGRKSFHLFQGLPYVRNVTPALESVAYLSLSRTLICVDDFERKGGLLSARDVLGLLSALKEQKKCKVVLILNDFSLQDEALKEYETYKEKVVDIEMHFEPTSAECAGIALDGTSSASTTLRECVVKLNINNIRVIKKIERLSALLEPALARYEKEVLLQALHSLVLFAWSYYIKGEHIPSPDYLKKSGFSMFGLDEKEETDQEKLWKSTLSAYGYLITDEFDLLIARTVETGYLDERALAAHAEKVNEKVIAQKSDSSFTEAWERYHNSFDDDGDEVLSGLFDSFKKNVGYISPVNLNGTVRLFRELDRDALANELIEHYISTRGSERTLFDLDDYAFAGDVTDSIVIQRFRETYAKARERKSLRDALNAIAGRSSWGGDDAEVLSSATVDDYYNVFKTERGKHLSSWVNTCLRFGRFANASDQDRKIAATATEALRKIARESPINARRVAKFGLRFSDENPT